MRVLIFSTDDHLYPAGGAESAMGEIMKRLPDIEFDLITARLRRTATHEEHIGNVHIYRLGFGIPRIDGYLLALFGHFLALRLHKKKPYDLMWCLMASYGAFSAVRVKKATGLPMLLTLQEGDAIEYILNKVQLVRGAFNDIFKSADGLQPISHFLLGWGKDMGFRGISHVIPNGVDVDSFTTTFPKEELEKMRTSWGFPANAFVLITSSRLEIKNGVGDVIEALPLMPDVYFVICGSGSLEEKLRARVKELGLEKRVRFLGFVKITELPKLFKSSDAFIRPSLSEGLGNAFLEALATRLPTIGTPVGGIPDFLVEGQTGFLCEPENPESIASAVARVRALPRAMQEQMQQTAYERVIQVYNWDRIASSMGEFFTELVTRHARTRP